MTKKQCNLSSIKYIYLIIPLGTMTQVLGGSTDYSGLNCEVDLCKNSTNCMASKYSLYMGGHEDALGYQSTNVTLCPKILEMFDNKFNMML